jgi:hypothetical protein
VNNARIVDCIQSKNETAVYLGLISSINLSLLPNFLVQNPQYAECCKYFKKSINCKPTQNHCPRFLSVNWHSCASEATSSVSRGQISAVSIKNTLVCEIRRMCENRQTYPMSLWRPPVKVTWFGFTKMKEMGKERITWQTLFRIVKKSDQGRIWVATLWY